MAMAASGEHQMQGKLCKCTICVTFRDAFVEEDRSGFNFRTSVYNFRFPEILNTNTKADEQVGFSSVAEVLENTPKDADAKQTTILKIVRFLTYLDIGKTELSLQDYIMIAEYLFEQDLETIEIDEKLAADFLQKISQLFVVTWFELAEVKNKKAEWAARQIRRYLALLLGIPSFTSQVIPLFFNTDLWPEKGPVNVLERLCKDWSNCLDTVSLLVNLTRIERICNRLEENSRCLEIIEDNLPFYCVHIQSYDDLGELLMLLLMNLTVSENFLRFLIESNEGFFMNIILADLISHPDCCDEPRKVVWTFLRNLAILEKGREMIIANLELYLGKILYPITGPETLDASEASFPWDVACVGPSKTRVKDEKIRECILDILYALCRYRKDRISLREMGVYQILKHYHIDELNPSLNDKIEDIVNILIRKEETEIEFDDIMDGLSLNPLKTEASENSEEKTILRPNSPSVKEAERKELIQTHETPDKNHQRHTTPLAFKVFIEDDENMQPSTNICTLEAQSSFRKPFDYYIFEVYYKLRASLFQVRRQRKQFEQSQTSNECKLSVIKEPIEPSENFMKKKLTELYGPMNFDEPLMQKRLTAMKHSIMDISTSHPDEIRIKLLEQHVEGVDPRSHEEQLLTIIQRMFPAEVQQMYGNLDPSKSTGEWFVFPRPPLREIRKQHFTMYDDNHLTVGRRRHVKSKDLNPTPLTNLHLYDPKFEYCFDMPYRILLEDPEDLISRAMSLRIVEFLNDFPLGITPDMFWLKFIKKHGYTPTYDHFGFSSLLAVLRRHETEMYIVESNSYMLIFPPHLENVSHPDTIVKRLWHFIKSVLSDADFCIRTTEIFKKIKDNYGVDFDPMDWAFASVNAFLNFIIHKFGYKDHMMVHREYNENTGNKTIFVDYLTWKCVELSKSVGNVDAEKSDIMRGSEKMEIRLGQIPKDYLRAKSTVNSYSNHLTRGTVEMAELKCVHDPERLILFFRSEIHKLWRFHTALQRSELLSMFISQHPPDPRLLVPGIYVLVHTKWGEFGPFWFRVKILLIDPESNKYYVYGIDFGFLEYVDLKDMRYMPRSKIGEEIAYAIPAKLNGVKNPGRMAKVPWDMSIVNHVFNTYLEEGTFLRVTLEEMHNDRTLGCAKWTISCDAVDKHLNKFYTTFEKSFVDDYMKEWKKRKNAKEKTKSSTKLPPSAMK